MTNISDPPRALPYLVARDETFCPRGVAHAAAML